MFLTIQTSQKINTYYKLLSIRRILFLQWHSSIARFIFYQCFPLSLGSLKSHCCIPCDHVRLNITSARIYQMLMLSVLNLWARADYFCHSARGKKYTKISLKLCEQKIKRIHSEWVCFWRCNHSVKTAQCKLNVNTFFHSYCVSRKEKTKYLLEVSLTPNSFKISRMIT